MRLTFEDIIREVERLLRTENVPYTAYDLMSITYGAVSDLTTLKPVLIKRYWFNSKINKQRYLLPPDVRQVLNVWYKPANASFLLESGVDINGNKYFAVLGSSNWQGWSQKGKLKWVVREGGRASPYPYSVLFSLQPFNTTIGTGGAGADEGFSPLWRGRVPRNGDFTPLRYVGEPYRPDDDFELGMGNFSGDLFTESVYLYIDPQFDLTDAPPSNFFLEEGTIIEELEDWVELEPIGSEASFPSNALTDSPILDQMNNRAYAVYGRELVLQFPVKKHGFRNILVEAVCSFNRPLRFVKPETDTGINRRYLRLLVVMTLRRVLEATVGTGAIEWISQLLREEATLLETIPSEIEYLNQPTYGASILPYRGSRHQEPRGLTPPEKHLQHYEWDIHRLGYWRPIFRFRNYLLENALAIPTEGVNAPCKVEFADGKVQETYCRLVKVSPFLDEFHILLNVSLGEGNIVRIRLPQRFNIYLQPTTTVLIGSNNIPIQANITEREESEMFEV
ncbi:MAG: hypothetical protein KatS3mg054_0585 [Chloroflexus sp.]|nr:MAG: hypothetical protein KatS3mg054_0585 [Chloroflexus sp.]